MRRASYVANANFAASSTADNAEGTAVGKVDEYYLGRLAAGTDTPDDIYILNHRQKPIVLREPRSSLR